MYRRAVLRAATAAFLLLWCMSGVWADAMVVSGRKVASRVPFVISGDDIFAPLLPALQHLGAKSEILPEAIKITTSAQQEVLISRTRPEATRDGVLRDMPGLPQKKGSELLLPAKAVGSLLGCNVRWDESASILFIHPWVRKFTLETLPDRWRITAAAEGPMTYESGRVQEGTPRLFVDLLNVDLANIPSELKAEEGGLRAARISQKCLSPAPEGDVVRLVVELAEWKPYHIQLGEGRRTLQIDFPLPGMQELPLEAPPVVLSGVSFRRVSPRLAVVTIATFGKAVIQSGADPEPPTVWVDLANADNRIPELPPKVEDRLISGLAIATSPARPGAQRLTISLTSAAEHLASSRPGEVRVLLGKLELSGLCVVIDPGHGGHDTGAIGRSGLLEKDVNLDIAQRVGRRLEAMNVKVRLTRTEDSPVIPWNRSDREEHRQELLARCAIADDCGANLFVSIHANARRSNPGAIRGAETYYRKDDSRLFAQVMQAEVTRATGLPDGGALYHPKPIIVLSQARPPAVLVEVAYLSNTEDERMLADPDFREQAAQGIVDGIKRYAEESGMLPELSRGEMRTDQPSGEQLEESQEE